MGAMAPGEQTTIPCLGRRYEQRRCATSTPQAPCLRIIPQREIVRLREVVES